MTLNEFLSLHPEVADLPVEFYTGGNGDGVPFEGHFWVSEGVLVIDLD